MKPNYIEYLRNMVGDKMVILNATAIVIVNEKNEILLQKRTDNLMWGLPGGLLELDETIQEGAIREVKEETNLDVVLEKFIGIFVNPMMIWHETDKAKVYSYAFEARVIGGSLRVNDEESLEFKYFPYNQIPEIHSVDNKQIINAYFNKKYNLVEGIRYDGNKI